MDTAQLAEIDRMLRIAESYAKDMDRETSHATVQALSAASRAWSALAATHLQRLGLLYSVENMAKIDAERERIVAQIEATP